ncbi:hypothetical protein ACK3SF_01840 [Candidatus Nanosalina sp. VS9-1]|uniref:hypothetical protein n=1 Tax=Candidatus Nanosalina sp. VS9-1 TaxID=3388566 RepID=UPI0039E1DFB9
MEIDEYREEFTSGAISLVIAVAVTYAVSLAYPSSDLQWALIAVAFASFFSGFFSTLQTE